MSFMIGCEDVTDYLKVENFYKDTIFTAKDLEEVMLENNLVRIATPPILRRDTGVHLFGVMEIKIVNEQIFFMEFYTKNTSGRTYTGYPCKTNIYGGSTYEYDLYQVFPGEDDQYTYPEHNGYVSIIQLNIKIHITKFYNLASTLSGGIELIFPDGFLQQHPESIIRFGNRRALKVNYIYVDVPYIYTKEDVTNFCGDLDLYEFRLPFDLFKDGYGFTFELLPEGVFWLSNSNEQSAIRLQIKPVIDTTAQTARYTCPSDVTMKELQSNSVIPPGAEISPTGSYSIEKNLTSTVKVTLEYTYTGSGTNILRVRTNDILSKVYENNVTYQFYKYSLKGDK